MGDRGGKGQREGEGKREKSLYFDTESSGETVSELRLFWKSHGWKSSNEKSMRARTQTHICNGRIICMHGSNVVRSAPRSFASTFAESIIACDKLTGDLLLLLSSLIIRTINKITEYHWLIYYSILL